MPRSKQSFVSVEAYAEHSDGWRHRVRLTGDNLLLITYQEYDYTNNRWVDKPGACEVSPLIAKALCDSIKLVAECDPLSDFHDKDADDE